jgi:molybdopterin-guanine dinucleotide biosynthesis protein B
MPANRITASCPVLGFVAFSGTGKTTLLKQLIPLLKARGLQLAVVKHTHHQFDIDTPGKDSYELRQAGAEQVMVASRRRWALMVETPNEVEDPQLDTLIQQLDSAALDLILVEGFKHTAIPKIELHRPELQKPLLCPGDQDIIAVASDAPLGQQINLPVLALNNPEAIADFVVGFIQQQPS